MKLGFALRACMSRDERAETLEGEKSVISSNISNIELNRYMNTF